MLRIDPEFKSLIPALSNEEYEQLEKNCIAEGIRESILVWDDIIIDGHNRYEIAQKHGLELRQEIRQFNDREEVMCWMIDNQVGRRNIAEFVKFELKDKKAEILRLIGKNKMSEGGKGLSINDKPSEKHNTQKIIAEELKWSTGKTAQAKIIKDKASEDIKEKLRNNDITINQAYQQVRKQEKLDNVQEKISQAKQESTGFIDIYDTDKKYNIIYADPAWEYWAGGMKNQSLHYPNMSLDNICNLPVSNITDDNCILLLWVTFPILQDCFKVIESWGFKYSTCGFNWIKKNKSGEGHFFGCGNWTRANSELCLIATKGQVIRLDASISQIVETAIEEHSKKPDVVRELITRLVGELPRIELFSRNAVDGWDCWGNEI